MKVKVTLVSNSLQPHVHTVHEILPARILEWVAVPSPGDLPNPGIKPRFPTLHNSLPAEPSGELKNTGVSSVSLLQGILPTQESNPGFLHCRQILYQLSYEGSPECFSCFLRQDCIAKNFHLRTVFAASHRFRVVILSLSSFSRNFLNFPFDFFSNLFVIYKGIV